MIILLKTKDRGTFQYNIPRLAEKPVMGILAVIDFYGYYLYITGNEKSSKKFYFEEDEIELDEEEKWILDEVPVFLCDEIECLPWKENEDKRKLYSKRVWEIFRECEGTIHIDEIAKIEGEL